MWPSSQTPVAVPTKDGELLGGDTDAHGCIGSAGYSWCEPKGKCLRLWEEACFVGLEEEFRNILAAKYDKSADEITVTITKQTDSHASGSVRFAPESSAGGLFLAAKIGNSWQMVYDGNGSVDCAKLRDEYGFPDEILKPNFCD